MSGRYGDKYRCRCLLVRISLRQITSIQVVSLGSSSIDRYATILKLVSTYKANVLVAIEKIDEREYGYQELY